MIEKNIVCLIKIERKLKEPGNIERGLNYVGYRAAHVSMQQLCRM